MAKEKAVATTGAAFNAVAVAGIDVSKLTLKKHVVIPTISIDGLKSGDSIMFKVMGDIRHVTTTNEDGTIKMDEKNPEQPARLPLLTITKLDTGEFGQIVLPCMVHNALKIEGELTGRLFGMQKGEQKAVKGAGRKMNVWQVVELDAPAE